jgi:hypothetical protein
MERWRVNGLPKVVLFGAVATAALSWAAMRWPRGLSFFGFESPYWDLGLLPVLVALAVKAYRLKDAEGARRRFLIGFEVCGFAAAIAYTLSCARPAKWSLVSVLLPFHTGYMLAPDMRMTWRELNPWGIFVDTVILVLLPMLPATLGGIVCSERITLRRMMVAVAIIAILFGGFVDTRRRARHYDRMGNYHRNQIVGQLYGHTGPDGGMVYEPSEIDRKGKAVSPRQQRLDRWHEAMAQKYWHSSFYPWSAAIRELPAPE